MRDWVPPNLKANGDPIVHGTRGSFRKACDRRISGLLNPDEATLVRDPILCLECLALLSEAL